MELITTRGRLDLFDDFNYSLNYKTADVINLTGRKSAFTKTITLPYTSRNALIFQGLNQANADNIGFDTRETLPCFLSHSGRVLLQGNLTVLTWSQLKERQEVDVQIVQVTKELVSAIKGVKLNELDFNYLNHDYNRENILLSYQGINIVNGLAQPKNGYIYPLVDYGKDDLTQSLNEWKVTDLRPCLFLKEILDVIFRTAGKTYSSSFFNSPYFTSLILLNTRKEITLTTAQKEPFSTNVLNPLEQNTFDFPFNWPIMTVEDFTDIRIDTIIVDDNLQWDITDPNNPTLTIEQSGNYRFTLTTELRHDYALYVPNVIASLLTVPLYVNQGNVQNYFILKRNGLNYTNYEINNTPLNTIWDQSGIVLFDPNPPPPPPIEWYTSNVELIEWTEEIVLSQGDVLEWQILRDEGVDSGLSNLLCLRFLLENTRITTELIEAQTQEGSEINFLNYIPEIKADAFVDTILNTFNLWVIDNPYQPDDLIIEPRTNFFELGGYVDWSPKLDVSREIKNIFFADDLPKIFRYKFKKSNDLNSKLFFDETQVGYCDFDSEVPVDITQGIQEIKSELTPLIATETEGLIFPKIFAQEEPLEPKTDIGKVLKIGFVNNRSGEYLITDANGQNVESDYIVCSEFDDPSSPTYSLSFGDPETSLLQSSPSYWNLYRLFHQLTEEEKTRRGAKIVELYVYLNENDISQLDLRRVVFINEVFYRIVSIDNFNPTKNSPTKVKLLQIDSVKYDFTSNEIIFKQSQGFIKLLSTNRDEPLNTNLNKYVGI